MEINIQPVEADSNTIVKELVSQLVALEPGTYSVGKDDQNQVNKMRAELRSHGFRSQAKKIGVGGQRTATKGEHKGNLVDVIHYDLRVTVTQPAGVPEPALPDEPKRPRKAKVEDNGQDASNVPDNPFGDPEATNVEENESKVKARR